MRVVVDSNALMMPFQYRINLDIELERLLGKFEIYVPSCVLGELKRISRRRQEAKAALQLASKYPVVEVASLGDRGVMEAAKKLNGMVLTNDRALITALHREGIGVIYMKQNHLVIYHD